MKEKLIPSLFHFGLKSRMIGLRLGKLGLTSIKQRAYLQPIAMELPTHLSKFGLQTKRASEPKHVRTPTTQSFMTQRKYFTISITSNQLPQSFLTVLTQMRVCLVIPLTFWDVLLSSSTRLRISLEMTASHTPHGKLLKSIIRTHTMRMAVLQSYAHSRWCPKRLCLPYQKMRLTLTR